MKTKRILPALASAAAAVMLFSACNNEIEMRRPPVPQIPSFFPEIENIHTYKAPLYWSVYEYCYEKERDGESTIDITADQWDEYIDWVATELLPYGYNMLCTDGFCAMLATGSDGYMTQYGSVPLADIVAKCKARGLKLGVYDNPLWLHGSDDTPIEGTEYTFGDLVYQKGDEVRNPKESDMWFRWIVAEHPGAKEYIDGFFKHYKELGVDFIRMDFMSWYEDGYDRNMGVVGRGYGRESYSRAMYYIAEAAKKYGIFTSVVMPHLYNDAAIEARYGNMVRIVADTGVGGWWHTSAQDKGIAYKNWPNCMNQFDGFVYWSHIAGKGKVILDGDFIRLNRFDTDDERRSVISLQLMAGGPVTPSDQPSTIGNNIGFYTNTEMLALNADGFVGHPLSDNLGDPDSQIWYGSMSDGSYVVALFNRADDSTTKSVKFADLGIDGTWKVRDLWSHTDEGEASSLTTSLPAHGCKVVRLTK